MMTKQQQVLNLVNFCNEFAAQHSVNGNSILVTYEPNRCIIFTVSNAQGETVKIFGHPSEKAGIWYINLNFCGIMQSIEDAVRYIKEYIYGANDDGEYQQTLYWLQENVSIPRIDNEQRREFLQQGLPETLSLTEWYKESL